MTCAVPVAPPPGDAGSIGDPHLVRTSSSDPEPRPLQYVLSSGGLFVYMTIHDFDMARFLTGIDNSRRAAPSVRDARAPLVIGLAAGRSVRERRPVRVAEISV